MTQREEDNVNRFGHAYNNIGKAVNDLCEIRGTGTTTARKLADKLEVIAKEIQEEMWKIKES